MKYFILAALFAGLPLFAQSTNTSAIIYADQYSVSYQLIIDNACPSAGCTIYATSSLASTTLGTIDPGTKVVTLYLGPFPYTVDHIVLRKGLRIIGMGASDAGTRLKSVNTSNAPMFSLPQTSGVPATDVYLYGMRLTGADGNTSQSGIWLDCSTLTNAGLWHSSFEDLYFDFFQGSSIGMFGRPNDAAAVNQFITMRNLWAIRERNSGPALRMEGAVGQIDCTDCHFDGYQSPTNPTGDNLQLFDGWANIFIGNLMGGVQVPYSIHFFNLTSQLANDGVNINGGDNITFIGTHFERLNGAYLLQAGTLSGGARLTIRAIWIASTEFAGNVGIDLQHPGNGFIVYDDAAKDVVLEVPFIPLTPDRVIAGPNAANVSMMFPYHEPTSYSSNIVGNLAVNGTLTKSAGSFKIDDPLDPENKTLSHSFVESPDMKNIYDGVAVLDKKGRAEVILPDWFGALNRDFRYQLSCIGQSAPVYVSQEVRNNRFKIAGGKPGLRVSWQITGTRHDPYANENRIPVEEVKPSAVRRDGK
jgi:hypothetical protein